MKQQSLKIFLKEETGPYELPKGWRWMRLGDKDLFEIILGRTPAKSDYSNKNTGLKVLKFRDVLETGEIFWNSNENGFIKKDRTNELREAMIKDILITSAAHSPESIGKKLAIVEDIPTIFKKVFFVGELICVRVISQEVEPKIVYYFLSSPKGYDFIRNVVGDGVHLTKGRLSHIQIPLPPLPEQKRIVARIEALFSKIDEIKRLRKEANDLAKPLLQSALHEAFSKADEKGWRWVRLGEVLSRKPQYGLTAKASKEALSIRYLRISDITDQGNLKNNDPRFLDLNEQEFNKYRLYEGDILIARSGSVGRVYLHHDYEQKVVFASYLIRFRLDTNQIIPKFFFYYGLSPLYKKYIEDTLRIVAQPNINAKEYSNLQIPLPPLPEQKRFIAYLDQISEKQKTLLKIYADIDNQITELKQSILTKAFRGQLGKQNCNNEL
ncbi:MAG TPA: hypothetical protein ENI51_06395 [Candidatus Atribacteria bacterium]|nr:hypothetical protein [Candidatus Atribacteria bacterium]